MTQAVRKTLHARIWQWIKDQIVQPVPEQDALCEYDCRKGQCSEGEWADCDRRLHKAAGELYPESRSPTSPTTPQANPHP